MDIVTADFKKNKFIQYSKKKVPVRTAGFPAYTYFLLKQMKEEGLKVQLPKGSLMTLGGGWKQFYAEQISKKDFYAFALDSYAPFTKINGVEQTA